MLCILVSSSTHAVACSSDEGSICIWNTLNGSIEREIQGIQLHKVAEGMR